jgi:ATP-dependent Clp protease ATP-binding subunit ClpA
MEKNTTSDLNDSLESQRTTSEKIIIEKRRRNQAYMALDYLLSAITYFDFFSSDAFKIVKNAKYLAQICNKNVTSELLLLPFFSYSSEVFRILKEFGITQELVENSVSSFQEKKKETFFEKRSNSVKRIFKDVKGFFVQETLSLNQNIKYSHEVNKLFEKSAENALLRFKTPVISPEILFITIIEEKSTKASKIIRKFLKKDIDWYLLRYKLIKRIHNQESNIRSEVVKNQHYFAYLMKIQLTDFEFNKLIETETLAQGVSLFRNSLISKILKVNIFDEISDEIYTSMKISNKRSYSS